MIWSILSAIVCAALAIRLIFFSDNHRSESNWFYRFVLFLVAVYCGHQVIQTMYTPQLPVSPYRALFHLTLLIGAFLIKPEYLPWNKCACPSKQKSLSFSLRYFWASALALGSVHTSPARKPSSSKTRT